MRQRLPVPAGPSKARKARSLGIHLLAFLLRLGRRLLRLPAWTWRAARKPGATFWKRLLQVVLVALFLLPLCGYFRGPEVDRFLMEQLTAGRESLRGLLATIVTEPRVVTGLLLVGQYALLCGAALALAWIVYQLPCYVGFLVLGDYHRRRGRNSSKLEVLLGLTLPVCLGLMVSCYGLVSLLALVHFVLGFTAIRFSTNPVRVNRNLDWGTRPVGYGGLETPDLMGEDGGEEDA